MKLKTTKYIITILFFVILTLPAYFRLIRPGFYRIYDDMQVIRVEQMDKCIKDWQIPCRWVPDLGLGYGYPLYIYYGPLPYYAMEIVHLTGLTFIGSVKLGFALSVLLSSIFMYKLARFFFGRAGSLIATLFYIFVPFRAAGIYVRGAMGEAWGLAALPMILLGFENLLRKKNVNSVVIFALTIVFFLTSHNLTVIMSIPLVIGWVLVRLIQERKEKELIKQLILSLFLGFLISSFFVLPLIFERGLVHIETLTSGYFYYVSHFLSLKQLLVETHWGYGPSVVGVNDDVFLGVGPMHTLVVLVAIVLLIKSKNYKDNLLWIFLVVVFWAGLFMAHGRSSFIWKTSDFFKFIQFPWRWVFISVFTSSMLVGLTFEKIKKVRIFILIFAVVTYFLYFGYFKPYNWIDINDAEKLSGDNYLRQITASIYDYLPKSAVKAPDNLPMKPIESDGNIDLISFSRGSNWYEYDISIDETTELTIPTYDFPNWTVYLDGIEIVHETKKPLGLISFNVDNGVHHVYALLKNSWPRKLGDILTTLGVTGVITLLIYDRKTRKVKG